jgi:hypothetical protein
MAICKPLWKSLANCGLTSNAAAAARFALKLDSAMASEKVLQGVALSSERRLVTNSNNNENR